MSTNTLADDGWMPLSSDHVAELAAQHLSADGPSDNPADRVQAIQSAHRLRLIERWLQRDDGHVDLALLRGRVLEAGCGQGDQTAALAAVMRRCPDLRHSVVHGVDPGPPDYGAPFTLKQAQSHLAEGELRDHLVFEERGTVSQALAHHPRPGHFTSIVFSHCLWYFESADAVLEAFQAAYDHGVQHMLLAEWSLRASDLRAVPHVLAALLQSHAPIPEGNIRLLLGPDAIKRLAERAGWKIEREETITPAPKLQDGRWEVSMAIDRAREVLKSQEGSVPRSAAVEPYLHALEQSLPSGRDEVTCMDVWTAVFVRSDSTAMSSLSE